MQPLIPFFDRVAIHLGPVTLGGFGLMVLAGFLVGAQITRRKLARTGFDTDLITRLLGLLAIGVYVGGHLGHVLLYYPETLSGEGARFANLLSTLAGGHLPTAAELPVLLKVWDGLSSYGGFLACALITIWFFRYNQVPTLPHADAVLYGLASGWMLARVGCFLAHDHPGVQTQFWLGVRGICPGAYGDSSVACHDLGLYEAIWSAAVAIGFALKDRIPRHPGYFVGWACVWYGPARFLLDFLRHPATDARYLGLTPAQYGSVPLALLGLYLLWAHRGLPPDRGPAGPPSSRRERTMHREARS